MRPPLVAALAVGAAAGAAAWLAGARPSTILYVALAGAAVVAAIVLLRRTR